MDISKNPKARACIISLCLAASCPKNQKHKLKELKKHTDDFKDQLLVEVQQFLISEADRLIDDADEFDRYYNDFVEGKEFHIFGVDE
tara:strand:+ start:12744 stop:13004 length:261 start_codon:yes stop_codon:yes gene_type:complete